MNILEYKKELRCLLEKMKFTVPGCPLLRNLIKNVKYVRIPLSETRSKSNAVSSLLLTLYSVKAEKAVVAGLKRQSYRYHLLLIKFNFGIFCKLWGFESFLWTCNTILSLY